MGLEEYTAYSLTSALYFKLDRFIAKNISITIEILIVFQKGALFS